jgi:hypothetical protein
MLELWEIQLGYRKAFWLVYEMGMQTEVMRVVWNKIEMSN